MKPALLLSLIASTATLSAQTPTPAAAPTPPAAEAPKLTEAQVNNVLSQLQELEKQILTQRGSNLSSILAKLNDAISSDQAAIKFYTDCDVLVNSERKEASKSEARQRAEQMERNMERKSKAGAGADDQEGDTALALRLGLRYLILTLEAHETKDDDFKKMVPKLQSYIQDLVASAPKLAGRSMGMLNRVSGPGSPVVQAFQLDRYLVREHWSRDAANFGGMYNQTLLFLAKDEAKDSLPTLWDSRINNEAAFRKEQMTEPEYALWLQNELPSLRWERATYLYKNGPSTINAMADMLKVIKEFPGHADAPKWVAELRSSVNESAAVPPSEAATGTN
jgi:hypothetical protein